MRIELLWWDGCPSYPETRSDLERVLDEEGVEAEVELVEVESDEQAQRERFPGSPTIRIGGEDILPPGEPEPFSLTCRVYRLRDGRVSPTPDPEDLRERYESARARPSRALAAEESGMSLKIGDEAPEFTLPSTDGAQHGPQGVTVVAFTCNHCPYALAWHDRLTQVATEYDVTFLLVNPNDADRYPRDSFDAMRKRVEAEGPWPAPYLRDESQEVARGYGAQTTPDVFVLDADRRLRYRGAPDADHRDEGQRAAWLREALDAVLAGQEPSRAETQPVGCSVKWK